MLRLTLLYFTAVVFRLSEGMPQNTSDSLDLRDQGLVSSVKNQASCAAGWAFAIIGVLEGQYAKQNGELIEFSPQELVDCLLDCDGCANCHVEKALNYLLTLGGVEQNNDYPFVGKKQSCQYKPAISKVTPTGYFSYDLRGHEQYLMKLLKELGPMFIGVDGDGLHDYGHDGVLDNCPYKEINHAVLVIGYGTENGVDYWLIKNSWGTAWGQKGYAKIRRGVNACGLLNSPIVKIFTSNV